MAAMRCFAFRLILLSLFVIVTYARPNEDKVENLPGINFRLRFEHYSGYLNAGEENFYHYWFFESASAPATDPLILFLNGGPGCSSLVGLFTECGPFRIEDGGKKLVEHIYAWNKVANIVFLESPAGTGFSYSENSWNLSDDQSVHRHYDALTSFYGKFPEFKGRSIFLLGQSYAAVYVTTLARLIQAKGNDFPGNLKGVAIGNGVLSLRLMINSRFYYNYYHGLLAEIPWRKVITDCCKGQPEWRCDLYEWYLNNSTRCYQQVKDALAVGEQGKDPYNINVECYRPSPGYLDDEECGTPFGNITTHYLDRPDVRAAAHIKVEMFRNYSFIACSDDVKAKYAIQFTDLTDTIIDILAKGGIRFLIFNGDYDSVCNFLGAQWFVDNLNRTKLGERRPIFYSEISQPNVGYQQNYDGLDFLIIRGAGHYVPANRPRESLQIIANFLRGETNYSVPYDVDTTPAPLLTNDATGGATNPIMLIMTMLPLLAFVFSLNAM